MLQEHENPDQTNRLREFASQLALKPQGPNILRAKGILNVDGEERRLVFQAVHMILEGDFQGTWKAGDDRSSRMVFIGRELNEAQLRAGFEACAV